VPITSDVAISNIAEDDVYLIQHCLIKCVSDLLHVSRFHGILRLPLPIKLTTTI